MIKQIYIFKYSGLTDLWQFEPDLIRSLQGVELLWKNRMNQPFLSQLLLLLKTRIHIEVFTLEMLRGRVLLPWYTFYLRFVAQKMLTFWYLTWGLLSFKSCIHLMLWYFDAHAISLAEIHRKLFYLCLLDLFGCIWPRNWVFVVLAFSFRSIFLKGFHIFFAIFDTFLQKINLEVIAAAICKIFFNFISFFMVVQLHLLS